MTTPVEIPITLDGQQYLSMSQQIVQSNQGLVGSMSAISQMSNGFNQTWGRMVPGQQHVRSLNAFTDAAAAQRKELQGLYAAQAAGGANAQKLVSGIRGLATAVPIGQSGASNIVNMLGELGVSAPGTEKKVLSLATTFGKLQGAIGGDGAQLGAGLVQLERTFGDQGLDPKRVKATADSLTTVSHELGASAQGTLQFANAIGPFAQASGIGKTSALGIAAAFSRIGQDGSYAANTVGTLLQGINQAVTQGTPDLSKYANILGTTSEHFQAIFKANPTGTLTSLTQALSQNTPQSQAQLSGLGLDSVRSQRALQALIQSGGLDDSISKAVGGYGNGSTDKASKAAFDNVVDTFGKISDSGLSLAQALGTPLLGAVNTFGKVIGSIAKPVAGATNSILGGPVGNVIGQFGLPLLAAGYLGKKVAAGGGLLGLAGTALGSNTVRSLAGGVAAGRAGGDLTAARESRLGRFATFGLRPGTQSVFDRMTTTGGQTYMGTNWRGDPIERGRLPQGAWMAGSAYGQARGPMPPPGPSFLRRFGGALRVATALPFEVAQGAFRATADMSQQTRMALRGEGGKALEPGTSRIIPTGAYRTAAMSFQDNFRAARAGGMSWGDAMKDSQKAFSELGKEVGGTTKAFGPLRNAAAAFGTVMTQNAKLGGAAVMTTGRALAPAASAIGGGVARAVGGLVNPTTALLAAGFGAYSMINASSSRTKQDVANAKNFDVYGDINAIREATGQSTLSAQAKTGSSYGAPSTQGTTAAAAASDGNGQTVTGAMIAQASGSRDKVVTKYGRGHSPEELAARVTSMYGNGVTPMTQTDRNGVMVDMLRQGYSPADVTKAMSLVAKQSTMSPTAPTGTAATASVISTAVQGGNIPVDIRTGTDTNKIAWDQTSGIGQYDLGGPTGTGIRGLKGEAPKDIENVRGAVQQLYQAQQGQYGETYAQQQRFKGVGEIFDQANQQSPNAYFLTQLSRSLNEELGGSSKTVISPDDVKNYGGYAAALAGKDKQFATVYQNYTSQPGFGNLDPKAALSPVGQQMQQISPNSKLADYFDNTKTNSLTMKYGPSTMPSTSQDARGAVQKSLGAPGDVGAQNQAVQKMLADANKSGASLVDLAASATKAMGAINDTSSAAYQLSSALSSAAQSQLARQAPFQSQGKSQGDQFTLGSKMMSDNEGVNAPDAQKAYAQGQEMVGGVITSVQDQMKQRLMAGYNEHKQELRMERDYQNQVGDSYADFYKQQQYAAEDYGRQRAYAEADYEKSTGRAIRDFNKSTARANEDFHKQQVRAEDDYHTQVARAQRDFNKSMERGQDDYFTTRQRSIRDFNKQLAREVEDQAKSIYDPYQRITTQAVWDTKNLLMNMQNQNQAIAQQKKQLDQLRGMGVNNQAIDQLSLNDPKNAQQLSEMVSNITSDPALAKQINAAAAQKLSLTSLLQGDPSNKDLKRAKDDFATQLADMEMDYKKMVSRAREDISKGLADQAADFAKQMARGAEDFRTQLQRSEADFQQQLSDAAADQATALARMDEQYATSAARAEEQFNTQMGRMARSYQNALSDMRQDLSDANKQITGDFATIWKAVQKQINGEQVEWSGLMEDGLNSTRLFIENNSGAFATAYQKLVGGDIRSLFPSAGGGGGGGGGGPGPMGPYASLGGDYTKLGTKDDIFQRLMAQYNSAIDGWPVDGASLTQKFHAPNHMGVDLAVARGTPIKAAIGGTVASLQSVGQSGGYGNLAVLSHGGGRTTYYAHQDHFAGGLQVGDSVRGGQVIGYVDSTGDSTGDHLHFETRQDGHPVDPEEVLKKWESAATGNGGLEPEYVGPFANLINFAKILDVLKERKKVELESAASETGDGSGAYPSSGGVLRWKPLVKEVLKELGLQEGLEAKVLRQMQTESGGDPNAVQGAAVNDINMQNGDPAKGLMQTISGTFAAYAGPYLSKGVFDPHANLYAGLNYAMHRYGPNLDSLGEGHGYRDGGMAMSKTPINGVFGEAGPEALIPLNRQGVSAMADAMRSAIGQSELRAMMVAGHNSPVTYHYESNVTHAGTHFEGPITVQADDPNAMAAALEARARERRLVNTGGKR